MKVIADREIRVATLWGAVIVFEPNVEQEVSDEIGVLALQLGAKQVMSASPPAVPSASPTDAFDGTAYIEQPTPDSVILSAIERIVAEGNPEDFKADGTPKASAVNREVGHNVSPEAREAAWTAFINS
jgi:hypothetical protein